MSRACPATAVPGWIGRGRFCHPVRMSHDESPRWAVVRGTGTGRDGRVYSRHRLPTGVDPDRFGLLRLEYTGEFEEVHGIRAAVLAPVPERYGWG
jgi:hypothetical protein